MTTAVPGVASANSTAAVGSPPGRRKNSETALNFVSPQAKPPIIELRDIRKTYTVNGKSLKVFNGLTCSIEAGSLFSIIGPSGCGKSTLLKMVAGLEPFSGGAILFNGAPVTSPPRGMIYIFQQYSKSIFPWRTVIKNIEFGLLSQKSMPRREARERCREYIHLVGLDGYEDYFPSQISGGMQQRVAIARALICEPSVLLMDEPFSAVDSMTRAILQELVLKIRETIPITILFVTHDVEEAVFLSNRIISLGRAGAGIVEDVTVPLAYPRNQITTRAEEEFIAIRQRMFSSIFMMEKATESVTP